MGLRAVRITNEQFGLIRKALADPKRFEMFERIAQSKETPTCTCLKDLTGLAPATVSHHLQELESAGLVAIERQGKFAHITLRRDVWNAYIQRLCDLIG